MNNNKFRSINNNIEGDVWRDGISPHFLRVYSEYKQLISIITNNPLNSILNSLSTLSVNYIEYFYHVFSLHLNSFNRLFSEVINPKLLELTKSVTEFTSLESKIPEFIGSLNGVSSYLNVNPAQELIKLIKEFSGDSYAQEVRSNIKDMIEELDKLNVKSKYEQIIQHLHSLARTYNQGLKTEFESFKKKIEKHNESLQENIKEYIKKINQSLTSHRSCVKKFIQSISQNISNLNINYSKLDKFKKYTSEKELKKPCIEWKNGTEHLKTIIEAHKEYEECLKICSEITKKLIEFIPELKCYSGKLDGKKVESEPSKLDTTKVDSVLSPLKTLEGHLDKFDGYMECVKKSEEIGKHISTMKSQLPSIRSKVRPEAAEYIQGLQDINIKREDVETIKNIKSVNKVIIGKLQIAKQTIDFHNILKDQISELNKLNVDFYYYYDQTNIEYLDRQFYTVKGKVESFEKNIKPKLCKVMEQIKKIKEEIKEANKNGVTCDDKTQVEKDYTSDISNITSFIDNSLKEINQIKDLIKLIQIKKNQSDTYLSDIKSKVSGITSLSDASTKLPVAVKEFENFVKVQEDTKFWIDQFSSYGQFRTLGQYSNTLDDIIDRSKSVIGYINYYIGYLKTVGNTDYLIRWIKNHYTSRFDTIKKIIDQFKLHVKEIIRRVETINSYLCQLSCTLVRDFPGYFPQITNGECSSSANNIGNYSLSKLKDYMKHLKVFVNNVKTDLANLKVIMDKIKKESSKIDTYKSELTRFERIVDEYIKWFDSWTKLKFIVNYLKSIKDKIKQILIIKNMVFNCLNIARIGKLESRLNSVESSIDKLECAIEGVARNLIQCTFQSSIINITNAPISDNNINKSGKPSKDNNNKRVFNL